MKFLKEACVENVQQAILAEKKGADRIELCADLISGGISPSYQTVRKAKEKLSIPVRVMIRPRKGNFVYSEAEFETMKEYIRFCKKEKVDGVVFGILNLDNTLDIERIKELTAIAFPLDIVIHKAIDETPDIIKSLYQLIELDTITTVLTSGGKLSAKEGRYTLKEMIAISKNKIEILPAGSITNQNILELHQFLNASSYHGRKIVGNLQENNLL